MKPFYIDRVNFILDYIEQNLDSDLSLKSLSKIAGVSPFHFHRIFSLICGETIHQLVTRKRIEKIAAILINNKQVSINELGLKYGFNNATSFSRAFKSFYGLSASEFRKLSVGEFNGIKKKKSKICKEKITIEDYIRGGEKIREWSEQNSTIEFTELPDIELAYLRHRGSFDKVLDSFKKLKKSMETMGILEANSTKWLMVINDNPAITEEQFMSQCVCIQLNSEVSLEPGVSKMTIPAGKFLKGSFNIHETEFKKAWDAMCIWMIDNGCNSRNGYFFELFHNNSLFSTNQYYQVDICIPV